MVGTGRPPGSRARFAGRSRCAAAACGVRRQDATRPDIVMRTSGADPRSAQARSTGDVPNRQRAALPAAKTQRCGEGAEDQSPRPEATEAPEAAGNLDAVGDHSRSEPEVSVGARWLWRRRSTALNPNPKWACERGGCGGGGRPLSARARSERGARWLWAALVDHSQPEPEIGVGQASGGRRRWSRGRPVRGRRRTRPWGRACRPSPRAGLRPLLPLWPGPAGAWWSGAGR